MQAADLGELSQIPINQSVLLNKPLLTQCSTEEL
jgi:hypothetical protein